MTLVAGVDGGGTRTRLALVDGEGRVRGLGESGPGNLRDVGLDGLRATLSDAWRAAWQEAGEAPRPCDAVFLGLAGASTRDDRAAVRRLVSELGWAGEGGIDVDHDLRVALAGGLAGRPGIAVIAGTGSSCYGRSADGTSWRAGGWGSVLDDRGSAYDLGRSALLACARATDGRGPETLLRAAIQEHWAMRDWDELCQRVDAARRSGIAALAPLVTRAADGGDAVARSIIEAGTDELGLAVATVAERIGMAAPEVAAVGGLAQSGPAWRGPFDRAVRARLPGARVVDPLVPPVLGAAIVALANAGSPLPEPGLAAMIEAWR